MSVELPNPEDMSAEQLEKEWDEKLRTVEEAAQCNECGGTSFVAVGNKENPSILCACCEVSPEDAPDLNLAQGKHSYGRVRLHNDGRAVLVSKLGTVATVYWSDDDINVESDRVNDRVVELDNELRDRGR